jgi:hypothetical protein
VRRILLALSALLFAIPAATAADDTFRAAAEAWLSLVDRQQYAASWDQAAPVFRAAVDKPKWEQTVRGVREPLGALVSRKFQSATHKTSMPGAPDGEYQVLQFETRFANKASAVETVTMMWDANSWKLAGYFIK